MTNDAQKLLKHIKEKIDLNKEFPETFNSLPICILDCVFSLNARYKSASNVVKNYKDSKLFKQDYNIDDFLNDKNKHGAENIKKIVQNNQYVGNRPKLNVCYDLANLLKTKFNINTIEDFANYEDQAFLKYSLCYIKGFGDAAADYLFMLTGDENRVKPDVHIHKCVEEAIGRKAKSNDECQNLFKEVASELNITPRKLDYCVWSYYSKFKDNY